jgi:hypothetical protein
MAKMLHETLGKFQDFQFFSMLEGKRAEKISKDEQKMKDEDAKEGAEVVKKLQDNLERFKSAAGDKIIKYKEFWEENKKAKESFEEQGQVYKMFDSDYVAAVLMLPDEAISDEEINAEIEDVDKDGDTSEPGEESAETAEEETEETPEEEEEEHEEEEKTEKPLVKESLNEADDLNLDFDEPSDEDPKIGAEDAPPEPSDENPIEEPSLDGEESPEIPEENPEEDPEGGKETGEETSEDPEMDFKEEEGTSECFVVYNMSGEEREEVFRTDSTTVIEQFKDFFENAFKGSMKEQILKFKQAQDEKKKETELAAREKMRQAKRAKLDQFMKA